MTTRDDALKIADAFCTRPVLLPTTVYLDHGEWIMAVTVPDHGTYVCRTREQALTLWRDLKRWGLRPGKGGDVK
jgi:hypothetical protein